MNVDESFLVKFENALKDDRRMVEWMNYNDR